MHTSQKFTKRPLAAPVFLCDCEPYEVERVFAGLVPKRRNGV